MKPGSYCRLRFNLEQRQILFGKSIGYILSVSNPLQKYPKYYQKLSVSRYRAHSEGRPNSWSVNVSVGHAIVFSFRNASVGNTDLPVGVLCLMFA